MAYRPVGEVPEAIHSIARPIRGEQTIAEIAEILATKRLVLLGGASHGTHELDDVRAAITRRLIAEHGFAALAVDADWPDALRVDRFIRGQSREDGDAEVALSAFDHFPRWVWRNADVAALVAWLHAHNAARPEPSRAGFYGLDLFALHASIKAVIDYFADNDRDTALCARERYACFDHVVGDTQHLAIGPKCETELVAQLAELQLRRLARSGRSPAGDAWFHAVQQAHLVRNAETSYRTLFAGRTTTWNARDTHMADTLDLLADHLGDGEPAKLVVWAHNCHVGDARATELANEGQLTLGQIVRKRHAGDVALVGLTTYEGSVLAAEQWDGPAERMRVRPALPGSWEELFHESAIGRAYFTAADMRRVIGENAERLERAIGVVYRPDTERRSHYLHARLADQFDLVIHVDSCRALEALDYSASRNAVASSPSRLSAS